MTEQSATVTPGSVSDTALENAPDPEQKAGIAAMATAAAATIGASLCCIGPLVLLSLGIGGTWVSSLTALTPYRPYFVVITLVFLFLAFRKLYLVPRSCKIGTACAIPSTLRNQRIIFWVVTVILTALLTFPYYGTIFFE